MSRSGYSDDCDNVQLWRAAVSSALKGKRGQLFLKEMLAALDALPAKRLIAEELVDESGNVCALGAVARKREVEVKDVDYFDPDSLAATFGIAPAMAQEIEYINDESCWDRGQYVGPGETPEERYERVRRWVVDNITDIAL